VVGSPQEAAGLTVGHAIVFRPEAEDEVLEARRWYESRSVGLGRRFAAAVDALVTRILANPLSFPEVHGQTRRAVLARFPYAVYFRVGDGDVVVLAVHGRQDPARWQARS
jgi:plasmid stabilization system protein ParE